MEEKELKTSPKQRFIIILIAVIMIGSIIASYAAIIISGSQGGSSSGIDEAKVAEYAEEYEKKQEEFAEATKDDFEKFVKYRNDVVKAYNETAANEGTVATTEDLEVGTGRKLGEGDKDYLAYYVGWCADGSVFDSSFNDKSNPTKFKGILDASMGLIEGWNKGVIGMKMDGIRVMTIPGMLAYGDSQEICGGTNKPLKFMVMVKENSGKLAELAKDLEEAMTRYQYALYGIEY